MAGHSKVAGLCEGKNIYCDAMFSLADLGQVADIRRGLVWSPDELRQ